jgi:hypothetical protein
MARPTALYFVNDVAISKLPELVQIGAVSGLKEFVIALLQYCEIENNREINRAQLNTALKNHLAVPQQGKAPKPLSTANSMISRRVKELEELGCLTVYAEHRRFEGSVRKCNIHQLSQITSLIAHLKNNSKSSPSPQGRPSRQNLVVYADSLEEQGITRLDTERDVVPYSEGAFGILESAARSGSDKEKLINCRYYLRKNDFIDIVASTSTKDNAGIMYSSDQRVIQASNGMLRRTILEAQTDLFDDEPAIRLSGEYCFFDIYHLTREIGLKANKSENRENVRRMIERLRDTKFSVDATHSEFWRTRYMPNQNLTKGEYSYITEFYSSHDWYEQECRAGDIA